MRKTLAALVLTVVALLGVGIVVVASASSTQGKTPDFYFKRQLMWLGVSIVAGFIVSRFDYHNWKKWLTWKNYPLLPVLFYVFVVVLLVLTLCPGIKHNINGSYRWLVFGPFNIQPGEFAKLAIIIATAAWMDHLQRRVTSFRLGIGVPAVLLGVFGLLLFLEKDLGAAVVIGVLGLSLMCVAGVRKLHLLPFATVAVALGALWISQDSHRLGRLKGWWQMVVNPSSVSSVNFHVNHSTTAFQIGGFKGSGLGESIQKHHYLPEAYTDFIAAIGGEELGFFFSIGIVLAYAILLICGVLISIRAPDRLGRLLAFGMTILLVFQGAFNIGVVTGLLPTKGLALPFISYGGSNLITALVAVGTLFNIGRQIDEHEERTYARVARDALNKA